MKRILCIAAVAVAGVQMSLQETAAKPFVPKISEEEARAIALQQVEGEIIDLDLEKEHGTWRYAIDVKTGKKVMDIEIDANTGKVLQVKEDD